MTKIDIIRNEYIKGSLIVMNIAGIIRKIDWHGLDTLKKKY